MNNIILKYCVLFFILSISNPEIRKLIARAINKRYTSTPTNTIPPVEIVYLNKKASAIRAMESREKNK
ncbi:MAG TPA: hypothetical protein ENI29_17120 [bacterium]|nr:hypothetical protein [bacterium]